MNFYFPMKFPWQRISARRRDSLHSLIRWVGMVAANTDVNCSYEAMSMFMERFRSRWPADLASNIIGTKNVFTLKESRTPTELV